MNDGKRLAAWGPYLASATVFGLFMVAQLQSCGRSEARLNALEDMAQPALAEHKDIQRQVDRHDGTITEINRRLARIEEILDRAPWVRNGAGGSK